MQRIPTLVGISGYFAGETFPLEYGKAISVGRSRTADFSLRRTQKYRAQATEEHDQDQSALTVSAKHFMITMYNLNSIEIRNLSPNGTRMDGKSIDSLVLEDVPKRAHEIRFGKDEVLRLEMRALEEL